MKRLALISTILSLLVQVAWGQGPSSTEAELLSNYLNKRSSYKHSSTKAFTADEQKQLDVAASLLSDNYKDSYSDHIVSWINGNYSLDRKDDLLAAYGQRPDEKLVREEMLAYYMIIGNQAKQTEFAKKLKSSYSTNTLNFYRDMLPVTGLLITSGKKDSYPIYILQHVFGEGKGVTVVNLDLMRNGTYKKEIQRAGQLGNLDFLGNERQYIENMVTASPKKVRVASTVNQNYLSRFSSSLYLTGLGYSYQPRDQRLMLDNFWKKVKRRNLAEISLTSSEKRLYRNYLPALMTLYKIIVLNEQQEPTLEAAIKALSKKVNKSETVNEILEDYEISR